MSATSDTSPSPTLTGEVLAVKVDFDANGSGELARIEGRELRIAVARA